MTSTKSCLDAVSVTKHKNKNSFFFFIKHKFREKIENNNNEQLGLLLLIEMKYIHKKRIAWFMFITQYHYSTRFS